MAGSTAHFNSVDIIARVWRSRKACAREREREKQNSVKSLAHEITLADDSGKHIFYIMFHIQVHMTCSYNQSRWDCILKLYLLHCQIGMATWLTNMARLCWNLFAPLKMEPSLRSVILRSTRTGQILGTTSLADIL